MIRVIGLTGGIASGKTTISNILKDLGAIIIDADKIARKIVEKGKPALNEIERYFGKEVLLENKELNRKKLASLVFNNPKLLKKLNEITHTYIIKEITNHINCYKKACNNRVIILDAALLIELDLMYLVEEVWIVSVPEEIQIKRLIKRENISIDEAEKRINSQMPFEDKKKYGDLIIDNSKDLTHLREQIEKNWNRIIN